MSSLNNLVDRTTRKSLTLAGYKFPLVLEIWEKLIKKASPKEADVFSANLSRLAEIYKLNLRTGAAESTVTSVQFLGACNELLRDTVNPLVNSGLISRKDWNASLEEIKMYLDF